MGYVRQRERVRPSAHPRHERRQECVALPSPFVTDRRRLPKARVGQKAEPDERGRAGGDEDTAVTDSRSDLPRDD